MIENALYTLAEAAQQELVEIPKGEYICGSLWEFSQASNGGS